MPVTARVASAIVRGTNGTPASCSAWATRWLSSAWTPGQSVSSSSEETPRAAGSRSCAAETSRRSSRATRVRVPRPSMRSYTVAVDGGGLPVCARALRVESRALAALARRRACGAPAMTVRFPELPQPDSPDPTRVGRHAARRARRSSTATSASSLCHSLSCIAWLHACAAVERPRRPRGARRTAVAQRAACRRSRRSSRWTPTRRRRRARRAQHPRWSCSDNDPFCPEGAAALYGEPLGLPDRPATRARRT